MKLYNSIFQRKSCRDYVQVPLDPATLAQLDEAIQSFEPLYADCKIAHRYTTKVSGHFVVKAPHYLILSGDGSEGELENAGFIFEQLALWFDAMGLGCVWLGASRDAESEHRSNDIVVIAFGKTASDNHRKLADFKRMDISQITNAPDDFAIKAAHLAPSGMNCQPWYFDKQGDTVNVYRRKLKLPVSTLYKLPVLDMGIGLCHYALACKEQGKSFSFERTDNLPEKAGHFPFGIIR